MKGFVISLLAALLALPAAAQVFTVQPEGVDAKYLQFTPTDVKLSTLPITDNDRRDILRFMQAEQGFSMRPLPVATLKLRANGKLDPSGSDYVSLVRKRGWRSKRASACGDGREGRKKQNRSGIQRRP